MATKDKQIGAQERQEMDELTSGLVTPLRAGFGNSIARNSAQTGLAATASAIGMGLAVQSASEEGLSAFAAVPQEAEGTPPAAETPEATTEETVPTEEELSEDR